jgi:catechol 2,3-dioxygenase
MAEFQLHPDTHIGAVHLAVADLDRTRHFYEGLLGFPVLSSQGHTVALTADGQGTLLLLTQQRGARPRPPRTTGLYHIAIRLPGRVDLGHALLHLSQARYPLQGAADHLVSESLYLADPDGNGLELYADRPREQWGRQDGQVSMSTEPLDVDGLVAEAERGDLSWAGMPAGTRIGHVHLQVHDLAQTEAFYSGLLGLNLTLRFGSGALFFAAGGYHHHVGANTWGSRDAPPPPPDAAGLRYFTLVLPDHGELERLVARVKGDGITWEERDEGLLLHDPAGNGVLLAVG